MGFVTLGLAVRASLCCVLVIVSIIPSLAQIPPGAPVIIGPQDIIMGNNVTLTCEVRGGMPLPTVKWLIDNEVVDDTYYTVGSLTTNEISFTASAQEHMKIFECQAENGVLQNPLSRTKFVEVSKTPNMPVLTGLTDVLSGTPSTWTCRSEGAYPAQTMQMRVGNTVFTNGFTTQVQLVDNNYNLFGTLNWTPTTVNNGITVYCDVFHPETLGQNSPQPVSLPLTVRSPLSIFAPQTLYSPTTGERVSLQCQVTAGSAIQIRWYKNNQLLTLIGNPRYSGSTPSNPSLTVLQVVLTDSGNYICEGTDGSVSKNTSVITVSPQAFVKSQNCPLTWDRVRRNYTKFSICVKRLPELVTWSQGEALCKEWIASPLAWNETMTFDDSSLGARLEFQEEEVWSSLIIRNGKLFHSGAPRTTIGLSPFAAPNEKEDSFITWRSDQPTMDSGKCVSLKLNRTAQLTSCSRKNYMYCQRHLIDPNIYEAPSYCPIGFVGNIYWGTCYKFVYEPTSFEGAQSKCKDIGATLLSLSSLVLSRNASQTADYKIWKASVIYFYIKYANPEVPNLEFWYNPMLGNNNTSCAKIAYTPQSTKSIFNEDCQSNIPFMCQVAGTIQTNKQMTIDIKIERELTRDRLLQTKCNISRPLSLGETIHITIDNKLIPYIYKSNERYQYVGDLTSVYPSIQRVGVHRCEVRGLHDKQIWFKEKYFQDQVTESVLFKGSIDSSIILLQTDVTKFNLATKPDTNLSPGFFSQSYILQNQWFSLISILREMISVNNEILKGDLTSSVNRFSSNGKTMEFEVMLRLSSQYTEIKEQKTLSVIKQIIKHFLSLQRKRRRREIGGLYFDPYSLIIASTHICSGKIFIPQLAIEVDFPPVQYGTIAISSDICITDKKPLATAQCVGGIGLSTELINIRVNEKCLFTDRITSDVTETLRNLTKTPIDQSNVQNVVETVKNVTLDTNILTPYDVISVADILVAAANLSNLNEQVVKDTIDIIDRITKVPVPILTRAQEKGSATNRMLEVVNSLSKVLILGNTRSFKVQRENILMEVYDLSPTTSNVIGIRIEGDKTVLLTNTSIETVTEGTDLDYTNIDAAIILPEELINRNQNSARVALNIYRNWNLFSVRSDIREYLPNSRVIAASLLIDGVFIESLGSYRVLSVFSPRMESKASVCGYWNYDINDASGGWATDGCQLNKTQSGQYTCVCDHLTNFAVLVNIGGQETLEDSLAIKIISWIGLIVSIGGLSLTVLSFLLFEHLRKGRAQQTLFNLALSLLCFLIVFIVGIEQTHDYNGCIAVAVLIHYFVLVSFMWMLMEGILQYLRFVKVLGTYIPNFILKTAVPAWGIPLIPVIIVLVYDHHLYNGGSKACWMSLKAFYYAFVIPVALIVLINTVVFIMIIKNLMGRPKGLQSNQSDRKRAMMNFRASLSVFILLGLTWVFGFFTIEKASVVFQYIFTILNVFQGFLIFLLFTAREKKVRQSWKKLCCKQKSKDKYEKYDTTTEQTKNKDRFDTNSSENGTHSTGINSSSGMI